jgi:FkbM family methyltransferase
VRFSRNQNKFGTLQRDLSPLKDAIDYRLTKYPALYLFVERFREWVNWDKRVYLSFVRPGDTVLDVGANVGAHTVFFSHLVRDNGQVLAFEPLPANIGAIDETIARRGRFSNIRIFPVAIGNPETVHQITTMKVPGRDLTQASLMYQAAGSWESDVEVTEITCAITGLDYESTVQQLPRVDFVKLDVEGGELDALKGAARTIMRHHPVIYCEVYEKWARSFGYTPADLLAFVRTLGYAEARLISKGQVQVLSLDETPPPDMFETSSDILLFTDRHRRLVDAFDDRYLS